MAASVGASTTLRSKPIKKRAQAGQTKTQVSMEASLATMDQGTPRYEALRSAIQFKRSWVDLAERLSLVASKSSYKEWGFKTIEAYALRELHLRRDTVSKLMRSYGFLASHEASMLAPPGEGEAPTALPSYQALDVLAEARDNPRLSEDQYRDIRDRVFTDHPNPSQVRKFVKDVAPDPEDEAQDSAAHLRKCLALAERLYGMLLDQEEMPTRVLESLEVVVGGLRQSLSDD